MLSEFSSSLASLRASHHPDQAVRCLRSVAELLGWHPDYLRHLVLELGIPTELTTDDGIGITADAIEWFSHGGFGGAL